MINFYYDLESDKIIKKSLIDNEIIISKRIILCGKWFNKISKTSKTSTPIIFYCKKWECRICRNKLLYEISKKRSKINSKLLYRGGNLIMISFYSFTRKNEIAENIFSKFKHCLRLLKESRCWVKLKKILDCKYHYENTDVLYKDNEYKFYNNIIYGSLANKIDIKLIEELIIN